MSKARILLVSEDKLAQKSLFEMLCRAGYKVEPTNSLSNSLISLANRPYQVVLAELNKKSEKKLIKEVRKVNAATKVILLASSDRQCIKQDNIFDCLVRPVEDKEVLSSIEAALSKNKGDKAVPVFSGKIPQKESAFFGLVGASPAMNDIYSIVERISNSKTTIILRGESGTGKRMVARAIHKADKKRQDKPFVEISCGALPREIIESELFGHTKGSFTGAINDRKGRFELANGGTILLDDIDSLALDLQVKLLRVLQEKEFERVGDNRTIKVDVRVIVTTNQDLEKAIAEKKFREDLYYRLNVISMYIPPLRERKEDLDSLIAHFVNLYSKENNKKINGIAEDVCEILANYSWPGNIRELENIIERAVILDTNSFIDTCDLPEIIINGSGVPAPHSKSNAAKEAVSLKNALQEPERVYILKVLSEVDGNKKKAAEKLGVNRTTLYNKLRKYNLLSYKK